MLDWLVGVVERARLAGDRAMRRDALRKTYRSFTALDATACAEHLARELGP
jgi:hypothetical protein